VLCGLVVGVAIGGLFTARARGRPAAQGAPTVRLYADFDARNGPVVRPFDIDVTGLLRDDCGPVRMPVPHLHGSGRRAAIAFHTSHSHSEAGTFYVSVTVRDRRGAALDSHAFPPFHAAKEEVREDDFAWQSRGSGGKGLTPGIYYFDVAEHH